MDGRLTERFRGHDRAHLAAWSHADVADGDWREVAYGQDGGRAMAPIARDQERHGQILLHFDQIGSVRVVEFPTDGMVKEIRYDAFGNVVRDGNPSLRAPLGISTERGGRPARRGYGPLSTARALRLARLPHLTSGPDTGRFTAQEPVGNAGCAAGRNTDWSGYCLDDPANGRDPQGLEDESPNGLEPPPQGPGGVQGDCGQDAGWLDAMPGLIPKGYLREDEKASLKQELEPKLQQWGKTMLLNAPWEVSIAQNVRKLVRDGLICPVAY